MATPIRVVKAHAYGNDFLMVEQEAVNGHDQQALAVAFCDRHSGIGADGLIVYKPGPKGARMTLYNPDGGVAEVSGNGVRCLGALLVHQSRSAEAPGTLSIESDGGTKHLHLLKRRGSRFTFRADMGSPSDFHELDLKVDGKPLKAIGLWMGNPQCVVLGPLPDLETFEHLGPALSAHAAFPKGTNVEFAEVESPGRVSILIWERGAGPTLSSGTGSCAAAVVAAKYGSASRTVDVAAPGGSQRVEWRDDGVRLTGWAELIVQGIWLAQLT
jgi:diaminopimelate epimerase